MRNNRPFYACLFYLALLATVLLAACSTPTMAEQEMIDEGEQVYIENCSRCHQIDGQGFSTVYPNLAGNPIVNLDSAVPTIQIVLHGAESMPAFAPRLGPDELAAVISYIRNSWGNTGSPVSPAQVR